MTPEPYTYRCLVDRVIDGDTLECDLDYVLLVAPATVGPGASIAAELHYRHKHHVRLVGIDCPEVNTPAGVAARAATVDWVRDAELLALAEWPFTVVTSANDQYGRPLVVLNRYDTKESLNDYLLEHGYAKPYKRGDHA